MGSNVLSPNELRAGESLENFKESFLHLLLSPTHHHELAELCRRPVDLDEHDQERGDRRARRQHLGVQRRLQRDRRLAEGDPRQVLEHRPACDERGDGGWDEVHVPLCQRPGPILWDRSIFIFLISYVYWLWSRHK